MAADFKTQNDLITWLSKPETYGPHIKKIKAIRTHISEIFLAGNRAYKLKRSVQFPYLDFSTPVKRHQACQNEIKINSRTAPEIYLGIIPVTLNDVGEFDFDGSGETVDWVIQMIRFKQKHLFDHLAEKGKLKSRVMENLAEIIFEFHETAEVIKKINGSSVVATIIDNNAKIFANAGGDIFEAAKLRRLDKRSRAKFALCKTKLDARAAIGKIRHCHGDLHLRNIVMQNRRPVLFDAIEFNDEFAKIDVMYDLAFLLMDLEFRGLKPLANAVLNRYLDRSGDIEALTCLPLFMSLRAAIRAHVSATMSASIEGHEKHRLVSAARRYLDLAIDYLTICRPRLIAIGGLSGTGKSRLARIMAPAIGPSPGAVVIRSDVLRKRLGGVELHKKLGEDGYNPEMTQRTYTDMMECAAKALNAGHTVIADAVFADPAERDAIQNVARNANMKFDGIWLEADQKTLEQRVANRKANVSDATVAVVRQQQNYDLGEVDWMKVNTSGPRKEVVRNARLIL